MSDVQVGKLTLPADTSGISEMKDKLADLKEGIPSTGALIDKFVESIKNIPGPVGVAAVGIVALGAAMIEMVKGTIEAETKLMELSEATGITVEKLQPFIAGMELGGISSDKLTASIGKLSVAVGQALEQPTGKAADAFKKLGISQEELASGDTEKIMKDAAAGFAQYADSITKTAAERELFGKQGPQIVAALQEEANFADLVTQSQKDYGTAITEADAKSAKYFGSTLSLAATMFQGVATAVTKALLPGLQELVNQFAESGRQGGFMRDMLDGLGEVLTLVARILITAIVEPIRIVVTLFKEAGTAIGAFGAAVAAVAHGDLTGAKSILSDMSAQIKQIDADAVSAAAKFEAKLWNVDTLEAVDVTAKKLGPSFEAFNASASKVSDTLEKLRVELAAQVAIQNAAALGLNEYKKAQDDVATATLRLQLTKEGASKADIASAVALKQSADASKQTTAEEVAGWTLVNRLVQENVGLTTHQSELQKNLAEIAANPAMTEQEKAIATALAQSNAQLKQQVTTKQEIASMNALAINDNAQEKAALTLSTAALKEFNQQLALKKQYEADLRKEGADQKALTTAYQQNSIAIKQNNADMQAFNTSIAGAQAGGTKAMADLYAGATNLNTITNSLVTQGINGLTTAFSSMGQGGGDAFKKVELALLQFIEQALIKFALLKIAVAGMEAMGISASTINAILGAGSAKTLARGGTLQYAASGLVTSATMVAPNTIAGEQGNSFGEAVLPLARTADGSLGVQVAGGGGGGSNGGGSTSMVQTFQINVNAQGNNDPQALAKQIADQVKQQQKVASAEIAKNLRPGGLLNKAQVNAF